MEVDAGELQKRPRRAATRSPSQSAPVRVTSSSGVAASASCNFCKQRHIRCDGKSPCGQCTKRHLDCQYGIRAKTGPKPRTNTDSIYNQLVSEIQIYRQRADYWKNKFLNFKAQMESETIGLTSPGSTSSNSTSSADVSSKSQAKLATRRAIRDSRRAIWSSALATMTYLTNLVQPGGMVAACYFEDTDVPITHIRVSNDHDDALPLSDDTVGATDDAPNESRVSLALDLFETSIGTMVADYKLNRSIPSAMSIWNMTMAEACKLDGPGLLLAFEHAVGLAFAFSAMQDVRSASRCALQMELLLRVVFFTRELHMLQQYADKLAHLLIHVLMFYSGDECVGKRESIVLLAYQIITLHRPFISSSSMHRIFMTMMTYSTNHKDRQQWMAEVIRCESSQEFNEVTQFRYAFHLFYVFCSIHPRMSYETSRPNFSYEDLAGFMEILENACLKLGDEETDHTPLASAYPDIVLSFHLFLHGTRAECLFLLGDQAAALRIAQWVIDSGRFIDNASWNLLFAIQSSLEICFVMKQLEWVYRAVNILKEHSHRLPLAAMFNRRNEEILNIHLPPEVALSFKKAHEERLTADANSNAADRNLKAVKHWKAITQSTPPLERVQASSDINSIILKPSTVADEHPQDPLTISNTLGRSVLDGTLSASVAQQLGLKFLNSDFVVTYSGPLGEHTIGSKSRGDPTEKSFTALNSTTPRRNFSSNTSDIDEEDVQALLSIGSLLEACEDDTLNTEMQASKHATSLPPDPLGTTSSGTPLLNPSSPLHQSTSSSRTMSSPQSPPVPTPRVSATRLSAPTQYPPELKTSIPTVDLKSGTAPPASTITLGVQPILPTAIPPGFPSLSPLFPTTTAQLPTSQPMSGNSASTATDMTYGMRLPLVPSYLLPAPYLLRPQSLPAFCGSGVAPMTLHSATPQAGTANLTMLSQATSPFLPSTMGGLNAPSSFYSQIPFQNYGSMAWFPGNMQSTSGTTIESPTSSMRLSSTFPNEHGLPKSEFSSQSATLVSPMPTSFLTPTSMLTPTSPLGHSLPKESIGWELSPQISATGNRLVGSRTPTTENSMSTPKHSN